MLLRPLAVVASRLVGSLQRRVVADRAVEQIAPAGHYLLEGCQESAASKPNVTTHLQYIFAGVRQV